MLTLSQIWEIMVYIMKTKGVKMSKSERSKQIAMAMMPKKGAALHLEHIATSIPEVVALNSKEFQLFTADEIGVKKAICEEMAFDSLVHREAVGADVMEQFFVEGIFLNGERVS